MTISSDLQQLIQTVTYLWAAIERSDIEIIQRKLEQMEPQRIQDLLILGSGKREGIEDWLHGIDERDISEYPSLWQKGYRLGRAAAWVAENN